MIPEKLESLVKESLRSGELPFLVGLTAGTTVLGWFFFVFKLINKLKFWFIYNFK